ncbi:bystin [Arachis hypogaea]|uniref:bystin n=1 Tax=Arachis hypogaea TaxID=3818 RepID=UPI000DEC8E0F|nr:bystin [Arachis hypogaea]XP_025609339.1 bystin [Arachis hypogaea]XP_025609340.1 bystin [Arachis hypogaea]XP_029143721.1 bystin [Arachis hypogaea]QHO27463.1 Bystin [Arachis hypogaea]QHO27464.1 Bystin [Arachis hypogaea]
MGKRKERILNPEQFAPDGTESVKRKKRTKAPKQHQKEAKLIDSNITSKIMKEALIQQKEEEENVNSSFHEIKDLPIDIEDEDGNIDEFPGFDETQSQFDGYEENINEEDERIIEAFLSNRQDRQKTLADLIVEKIKEKAGSVSLEHQSVPKLDQFVIDLYKGVGTILSKYTTGKLPKAIKPVPSMAQWEEILYLTEPENWSPHALYQVTRIFASNLNTKKAERFYKLVLLPRVREDIRKSKKLHFSVYETLKKALYKPGAFFKGILFPLCESCRCENREAIIIGSAMSKVSIPSFHSSAALLRLARMEYCGTTSYFIKILLEKKYALPYRVVDAVVAHFIRFLDDTRLMPVIWHQTLLAFVQRYKNELLKEDKDNLRILLEKQSHRLITPEIIRELNHSRNRGEKEEDLMSISSPVSVIIKPIEEDRFDIPEVPMEED